MVRSAKTLVAGIALGALLGIGYLYKQQTGPSPAKEQITLSKAPAKKPAPTTPNKPLESLLEDIVDNGDTIEFDDKVIASVSQALATDPSKVTATLTQEWIRRYTQTNLHTSLTGAIKRSSAHIAQIRQIFIDHGVPPEYAFLAIPESHWLNKKSHQGAHGVYQFMPETAKGYKATITTGYDSRLHPIEAGTFAAQFLRDLYGKFNRDWLLTLAAYNSGMPLKYLKVRKNFGDGTVSYFNYLHYLGKELKKIDDFAKAESAKPAFIRLKKKGTIDDVLKLLKLPRTDENRAEMAKVNKNRRSYNAKESVFIPPRLRYESIVKRSKSRFIDENLKYPPKFLAVASILRDEFPDYFNTPPQPLQYTLFTVQKQPYNIHSVQRNESLSAIGKQYGISERVLRDYNKLKRKHLRFKERIMIPYNLLTIAKQHQIPLKQLSLDNPHVRQINKDYAPLPYGARVYLRK